MKFLMTVWLVLTGSVVGMVPSGGAQGGDVVRVPADGCTLINAPAFNEFEWNEFVSDNPGCVQHPDDLAFVGVEYEYVDDNGCVGVWTAPDTEFAFSPAAGELTVSVLPLISASCFELAEAGEVEVTTVVDGVSTGPFAATQQIENDFRLQSDLAMDCASDSEFASDRSRTISLVVTDASSGDELFSRDTAFRTAEHEFFDCWFDSVDRIAGTTDVSPVQCDFIPFGTGSFDGVSLLFDILMVPDLGCGFSTISRGVPYVPGERSGFAIIGGWWQLQGTPATDVAVECPGQLGWDIGQISSESPRVVRYFVDLDANCDPISISRQVRSTFMVFETASTPPEPEVSPSGPADDQVLRLYRAVFGRVPDAGGFEFWTSQYREGRSLESIVDEFVASNEFSSRYGSSPSSEELVDAMYLNVLGREGDAGGVAFWLDRLANGLTVRELLQSFADSPENIEATGTSQPLSSIESKVLRLYRAVYGRSPDEGGFRFWVGQAAGGRSMLSIAAAFEAAPEFGDRYGAEPTDQELIDALYRNVLDRAGDQGGIEFWLGRRAGGMTVPELLLAFADSPENLANTGTRP